MEQILARIPDSPLVSFTILLLVILVTPPIFERLKLPGLVGLLVAGVLLGNNGLNLLSAESETMDLLSDIGKIYLMFVAGLEIDLAEFHKTKYRSLGFGIGTFLVPLIAGTAVGLAFGFSLNASVLLGSLLASHTLLGYPIVTRLGVASNEAVTITIGATIFTDIAALLVLAICISIHSGEFSAETLIIQLGSLAIYTALVLFGIDWAGKEYFRRTGDEQSNQFLFVLLAVFLASVGAQVINVDKIVGAFLAGLAVNDVVGHGPVEEKIEFVGSTLFIPFFFVGMGLLLDVPGFVQTITSDFWLTTTILLGLLSGKFVAAAIAKFMNGYTWSEGLTMWSLSLPQVAATLAAALAAYEVNLISESIFNAIIVLMLITSILGPVLTSRFARNLSVPKLLVTEEEPQGELWGKMQPEDTTPFNVIVPIYNPLTERYLIEMAAMLARHESGYIVPISVAQAHVHMDEPELDFAIESSKKLLERALEASKEFRVKALPQFRIDDDIAHGISRAAREQDAKLIVMGWSEREGLRARLFGSVVDSVFWSSHCPVAVMRLTEKPANFHHILVPIKAITTKALRTIKFALFFADTNQAEVTILHVGDRLTTQEELKDFEEELRKVLSTQTKGGERTEIKSMRSDDISGTIVNVAHNYDLVVLRSVRRRTVGGLAVSGVTTRVIQEITCSLVLFGEAS